MIRLLAVALALVLASPARAEDETKALGSFSELRAEVLDAIGGASRRIWLVTDYLTDGEIVSALYLAQYRKLDVQVLLGGPKANFYMSRLNYLKNQNIPVFLKPETFKPGQPTAILADDRLVLVDGDLDFLAKVRQYRVTQGAPERRDAFQAAFASAVGLRVPAVPHQVPLVGKAQGKGRVFSPSGAGAAGWQQATPSGGTRTGGPTPRVDASGAYVYDRVHEPRPNGVPSKLPKAVKWSGDQPAPRAAQSKPAAEPAPSALEPVAPTLPEGG